MISNIIDLPHIGILKNLSWTLIGNCLYAGAQWAILIIFAKVGSAEMVGEFTFGLAITAPIYMLSNLQLRAVHVTDYFNCYTFGSYLGLRILTSLASLIIIVSFLVVKANWSLIITLIAFAKSIESISDILYGVPQKHARMDYVSKSLIVKGLLTIVIISLLMYAFRNLYIAIIGLVLIWLSILLLYDLRTASMFDSIIPRFSTVDFYNLIKVSFPLAITMFISSFNNNLPRYFLENLIGLEQLGYYAAIVYFSQIGTFVISATGQSVCSHLSEYFARNELLRYKKTMNIMFLGAFTLGFSGLLISLVFGREVLTLFYRSNYANYYNVLVLIAISSIPEYLSSVLGYGLTAARFFKIQPIILGITVVLNALFCFLFIPQMGIGGAAFATICSSIAQCSMYFLAYFRALMPPLKVSKLLN